VEWLKARGILLERKPCQNEACECELVWGVNATVADGLQMICHECKMTCSIRTGTISQNSKPALAELTRIIFHYFANHTAINSCVEGMLLSEKTKRTIYAKIRRTIPFT